MKVLKVMFAAFFLGLLSVPAARADNDWGDKLGRGVLNIVASPVDLARTIHIQSNAKGPAYGWTVGIVEGLGRTLVRIGAGAIEVVTFPFDFPDEDKEPLLEPEYPWQKWDGEYL